MKTGSVAAIVALAVIVCMPAALLAQATPPPPARYVNDYAGLLPAGEADRLGEKLRAFDEQTSTQIVVAIFDALPENAELVDFSVRTAQAWRVGRKELDNGAVLFVFVKNRQLRLEVGYGLEGALPDALARRILDDEIVPGFRAGNHAAGLEAGLDAIMAATRGEYTAAARRRGGGAMTGLVIFVAIVVAFIILATIASRATGVNYHSGGVTKSRRSRRSSSFWTGGFSSGGSGGWSGGGGFSGGFSGGGGSFGGGGASSSW